MLILCQQNIRKLLKLTEAADKKAIKDAIKAGKDVPGCSIVENLNLKIN